MMHRTFVLIAAIALSTLAGCATTIRTPFGTTTSYNGTTTYVPAPESPAYHHAESFPGGYCNYYSTGTGATMRIFRGDCHSN